MVCKVIALVWVLFVYFALVLVGLYIWVYVCGRGQCVFDLCLCDLYVLFRFRR